MARYKHIDTNPRLLAIDLASQLLPGSFHARFRNDATGATAYPPAMLLKVVLFADSHGIVSTLGADIARVLAAVVAICDAQGLIGREMFAIDGVKLPSNAAKSTSGTRADRERQAAKLEAATTVDAVLAHAGRARVREPAPQQAARSLHAAGAHEGRWPMEALLSGAEHRKAGPRGLRGVGTPPGDRRSGAKRAGCVPSIEHSTTSRADAPPRCRRDKAFPTASTTKPTCPARSMSYESRKAVVRAGSGAAPGSASSGGRGSPIIYGTGSGDPLERSNPASHSYSPPPTSRPIASSSSGV